MISCKIGLISLPRDQTLDTLILGEIFDKNIRNNIQTLYEFHKNLRYLSSFRVIVKNKQINVDNIEDIIVFQNKYKLTRKITTKNPLKDGIIKYSPPMLYDIDCMVPLFHNTLYKHIYHIPNTKFIRVFILLPIIDPIVRGEIIDNCIDYCKGFHAYFLTIGNKYGLNSKNTSNITRRNLLSYKIPDSNIFINHYYEYPDCIIESIKIVDNICKPHEIYIGVNRERISEVLTFIKLIRNLGLCNIKIKFICK